MFYRVVLIVLLVFGTLNASNDHVDISIKEHILLPDGRPGFRIVLRGWPSYDQIGLYMIAPDGQIVSLLENYMTGEKNGEGMSIDIDYGHKRLYPGLWLVMVAGKKGGMHQTRVKIPKVVDMKRWHKRWKLIYD